MHLVTQKDGLTLHTRGYKGGLGGRTPNEVSSCGHLGSSFLVKLSLKHRNPYEKKFVVILICKRNTDISFNLWCLGSFIIVNFMINVVLKCK